VRNQVRSKGKPVLSSLRNSTYESALIKSAIRYFVLGNWSFMVAIYGSRTSRPSELWSKLVYISALRFCDMNHILLRNYIKCRFSFRPRNLIFEL